MIDRDKKFSLLLTAVFLFLTTLRYPLLMFYPFPAASHAGDFYLINPSVIGGFSLVMILADGDIMRGLRKNLLFTVSLFLFFLTVVVQFFIFDNYTFNEFCFSVMWMSVPFAVYLHADSFKRCLLPYFAFLWFFNAIYAVPEIILNDESFGIPANRNWHAGFILGATPLFLFFLYRLLEKYRVTRMTVYFILSLPAIIAVILLYKCASRGAYLALLITSVVFLFMMLRRSQNSVLLRRTLLLCSGGTFIILISAFILYGDKLAGLMMHDVRIPLWQGAVKMFLKNSFIGVGAPSFESHYSYNIPVSKFVRSWYYSVRSDNPHNHLLYMAGSFGLASLFAVIYLWFYPVIYAFRRYAKLTLLMKIVLFSFLVLSIHAMFDLIFFKWPTLYMGLLLQGLLWDTVFTKEALCDTEKKSKMAEDSASSSFLRIPAHLFLFLVSLMLCIYTSVLMWRNIKGSLYSRAALIAFNSDDRPLSLYYFNKSLYMNREPRSIYNAGILSLLYFNDHRLGLKYFSLLERHPAKIVAHINSHMAQCCLRMERKEEALAYLNNEIKVYPLSVIAYYNKIRLEKSMNRIDAAQKSALRLESVLKFKGMTVDDISTVLKNPELDGRYHEIHNGE